MVIMAKKFEDNNIAAFIEAVHKYFPNWKMEILDYGIQYFKGIANFFYDLSETKKSSVKVKNSIQFTFDTKAIHSLAVIGSISQFIDSNETSKKLIELLICLELLIVDLPDSLGDIGGFRDFEGQKSIYNTVSSLFKNGNNFNGKLELNLEGAEVFCSLYENLIERATVCFEALYKRADIQDKENVMLACARIVDDYGMCVLIMHEQDLQVKSQYSEQYLLESNDRVIEPWLNDSSIWYLAQGSPLGIYAILLAFFNDSHLKAEEIKILVNFYDQTVPLLHVYLDDIQDAEEDIFNNDENIYLNLTESNDKNRFYRNHSHKEFNYDLINSYKTRKSSLIKKFAGAAEPNTKLVSDMVLFYLLLIKNKNSIEYREERITTIKQIYDEITK